MADLDLEALHRLERIEFRLPPHFVREERVSVDGATWDAILAALERQREHLREKNEIIKAYAGPKGMTPEDVAAALERARRVEAAARCASRWEHAHDCGEFGAVSFRVCTCGLDKFRAALNPSPPAPAADASEEVR